MNTYLIRSISVHFIFLGLLLWSPWMRQTQPLFIDGFDWEGSGGGGGGGGGGPKAQHMGQVVPQPQKIPLPDKPAPVQKEQKADETWKTTVKTPPQKEQKTETPPVPIGEKTVKEQSNLIRKGISDGTTAGEGYDFGAEGPGKGPGVGIGIGPGMGAGSGGGTGFGFGSYLGILRRRIWQEWTQSSVIGTNYMCVIGLTVNRSGNVYDIKLEKPSGNSFYDNVAMRAVRNSNPLPPLPSGFPNPEQRFRIAFRLIE